MNPSSKHPKIPPTIARLCLGAFGGTLLSGGVLLLFAFAVGDNFWGALVTGGWDGTALGLISGLAALEGASLARAVLAFSLFGGVVGVALAGRDCRIRSEMQALRRTRENLLQALLSSERYATMGELAGEIGHELNNYLAIARAQVELFSHALGELLDERTERYLDSLSSQLVRMQRMGRGLMGLRGDRPNRQACDISRILRETIEFVSPLGRFDDVKFSTDLAQDLPPVTADPQQMQQVFLNLFNNGSDAMAGRGGRIVVSTRLRDDEGSVEVMIHDDGPGIHPSILARVFDAGFTTRRDGHGFGLAVCKRIVEQHGARLSLHSEPGEGTTFLLTLPTATCPPDVVPGEPDLDFLPERHAEPTHW